MKFERQYYSYNKDAQVIWSGISSYELGGYLSEELRSWIELQETLRGCEIQRSDQVHNSYKVTNQQGCVGLGDTNRKQL